MSVTIVSAMPQTTPTQQASSTDSSAGLDGGAAGFDFANILLGQTLKGLITKAGNAIVPEETDKTLAQTDAGEVDATSILAALGLATPQPAVVSTAANTETKNMPAAASGAADDSTVSLVLSAAGAKEPVKPEVMPSVAGADSGIAADVTDTPAKFAAVATAAAENAAPTDAKIKSDEHARTIATVANPPPTTAQRETPLAVHAHVRDQTWSSEFSQKIVWLANADKQSAQLTLNPPQMGPIEISLSVDKGSASASFVSANQEVRDAIETALPRLREMFASAGIQLGQTNVSSESFRQQGENAAASLARSQAGGDNDILAVGSIDPLTSRAFRGLAGNGLVDLFA